MIRAVVFDCDGVLADSEPHSVAAWRSVLDRLGHPGTNEAISACTGLGFEATRDALDRFGPLPVADELWPSVAAAIEDSFASGLDPFPDAVDVFFDLAQSGVPLAVASSSPRRRLDLTLELIGIASIVSVSVAGDEVVNGKPAPDIYCEALRQLMLTTESQGGQVAIEDSAPGVAAAREAGLRVIGVAREPGHRPGLSAAGAHLVVEELTVQMIEEVIAV